MAYPTNFAASSAPSSASSPMLEGLKVIDLTSIVFGPYCTQIMADMGADVIKVEPPGGDYMRASGHYARTPRMGAAHMTLNRGKRSVVLDLKDAVGAEAMRRLLSDADIFIHNVRGSAMDRLGFGYEAVKAINPTIIYMHCVGYGSGGPYADLPAYDDVIQAASGVTTLPGRVDGDPTPRYMPTTIVDKVAGLHAAYAGLAAVIHRLRTGEGQWVEVPMFEAFTHFLLEEHLSGATFDPPLGEAGYRRQIEPHRQPFPTADGYISIVPYQDANWIKVFDILGRPEILAQDHLSTPAQRVAHAGELYAAMAELTPARSTADWVERLRNVSIPAVPVRDLAEILDDPHLVATGFFKRREHPTEGGYVEMQPPVHFANRPTGELRPAPLLGQHTDEVLEALGLGSDHRAIGG